MSNDLLVVKNLKKSYSGVTVLQDIDINFRAGEVHAIVGENGAGKSTLIKLISGAIEPDCGEIIFEGQSFSKLNPALSKSLGINVIYQEFTLAQNMSVAENVYLGKAIRNGIIIDQKAMAEGAKKIFDKLGVNISPSATVNKLSVAQMQLVEIAKALSSTTKCLIMDEPTAPLTDNEIETLFKMIEQLRAEGMLIIYISHRMEEIYRIADRVTVLRDGRFITTLNVSEAPMSLLIKHMVGRELADIYPEKEKKTEEEVVLEVNNLCGNGDTDISFKLHKGEILGIGGLVGAGRTELVRLLFGAEKATSGDIIVNGKKVTINQPTDAVKNGIALITEDRKTQGLIMRFNVGFNTVLTVLKKISDGIKINKATERSVINKYFEKLKIKANSPEQMVSALSGGNQQKVVLAKWLAADCNIIIMDEPTRGIDVGTKQEIYKLMVELTNEGKSIIMISSEMPELLGMSDRVIVLCEGRKTGELNRDEFDQSKVLSLAMAVEGNE